MTIFRELYPQNQVPFAVCYHPLNEDVLGHVDHSYTQEHRVTVYHSHPPAHDLIPLFLRILSAKQFDQASQILSRVQHCSQSLACFSADESSVMFGNVNSLNDQELQSDNFLYQRIFDLYTEAVEQEYSQEA